MTLRTTWPRIALVLGGALASASRASPTGVDVPCGLITSTSSAFTPRRWSAIFIARADPVPCSMGWIMSQPSAAEP